MSAVSTRPRGKPAVRAAQEHAAARASHTAHLALVGSRSTDALESPHGGSEQRSPQQLFCARLKATRERRGIALPSLAQSTKVSASHFAALERGDLSRWPAGVYKRAFFRAYASGIGLPPEAALDEFARLFPDHDDVPAERPSVQEARDPNAFRLMLAADPARMTPARAFASHGGIDTAAAVLLAIVVIWWLDVSAWMAIILLTLGCYSQLSRLVRRIQLAMRR